MKKIKEFIYKQIICIILIVMLCNFITPKMSYAFDEDGGGNLVGIIAKFLCFVPDSLTNMLQKMFVSPDGIDEENEYKILYSPATIFAGRIPAFDTNFFHPQSKEQIKRY